MENPDYSVQRRKKSALSGQIEEKFVRSSGPGGQNVNKTSTCVYLKHIPTGIEVKCQSERSQSANRRIARQLLAAKIEEFEKRRRVSEVFLKEKIRRQNRRRSLQSKERILEHKKKHSEKKRLRAFHPEI
ncbi:MAG: peptide chain release factor-like protein [Candidatus Omnitrophica bacterium]|nr:peptide chain release factor-like protein [Candidatus Omnitrophota bacterium]